MIEEQIKDDEKRELAQKRRQNSEIGILKSDNLLTKAEGMSSERTPKNENTSTQIKTQHP